MLDFSDAPEQNDGVKVIPPDSCVKVCLHIQYPADKQKPVGNSPELTIAQSGLQYMWCLLEVVGDNPYAGAKIYHNFSLENPRNPGQIKSIQISRAQIKAILQYVRRKDFMAGKGNYALQSYSQLENCIFPIKVTCEASTQTTKDGQFFYTRNRMTRVLTEKDAHFQDVERDGYWDSEEAIPTYPNLGGQAQSQSQYNDGGYQDTTQYQAGTTNMDRYSGKIDETPF